jgi:ribosome-binding factor A
MERMARAVQTEVSSIVLFELGDPRTRFATITRVQMSHDLRYAKVFVSILGSDTDERLALSALKHARGHIQHVLGERLPARFTPVLEFVLDPSIKKSIEMSKLLHDVLAESAPAEQSTEEGPGEAQSPDETDEEGGGKPETRNPKPE